jgi:hypothetical protein
MAYRFTGAGTVCGIAFPKKLRKLDLDDPENDCDTTGGGDAYKTYESGIPDQKLTCEVLGGDALVKGTTGAVNVTWGDGTSTNWASGTVTSRKKSGSVGQAIVYTVTIRQMT